MIYKPSLRLILPLWRKSIKSAYNNAEINTHTLACLDRFSILLNFFADNSESKIALTY